MFCQLLWGQGTHAFMSGQALLNSSSYQHNVQDEIESLIHVLLFTSAVWLDHELNEEELAHEIAYFFADKDEDSKSTWAGAMKREFLTHPSRGIAFIEGFGFKSVGVEELIKRSFQIISTRYVAIVMQDPANLIFQASPASTVQLSVAQFEPVFIRCLNLVSEAEVRTSKYEKVLQRIKIYVAAFPSVLLSGSSAKRGREGEGGPAKVRKQPLN